MNIQVNKILQCRCCNKTFIYNDLITLTNERLEINEKACPNCRSQTYGLVDYPIREELLIYKSKNFHKKDRITIKHIKRYNVYEFINEEEFV